MITNYLEFSSKCLILRRLAVLKRAVVKRHFSGPLDLSYIVIYHTKSSWATCTSAQPLSPRTPHAWLARRAEVAS